MNWSIGNLGSMQELLFYPFGWRGLKIRHRSYSKLVLNCKHIREGDQWNYLNKVWLLSLITCYWLFFLARVTSAPQKILLWVEQDFIFFWKHAFKIQTLSEVIANSPIKCKLEVKRPLFKKWVLDLFKAYFFLFHVLHFRFI